MGRGCPRRAPHVRPGATQAGPSGRRRHRGPKSGRQAGMAGAGRTYGAVGQPPPPGHRHLSRAPCPGRGGPAALATCVPAGARARRGPRRPAGSSMPPCMGVHRRRRTPDGGPPARTAGHPTPTTCPLECAARGASRATLARPALARAPASRPARSAGPPHAGGRGGGARGAASRPASCCRLPVSESLSQPTKKPTRARTRGAVRGVADVQRCLPTISCTRT